MKNLLDKFNDALHEERDPNNDDQGCAFAVCVMAMMLLLLIATIYVLTHVL